MIGSVSLQARLAALFLLLLAILWGGLLLQARLDAEASARAEVETRLRETSALLLSVSQETGFDREAIEAVVVPALTLQGAGQLDVPDFEVRERGALITRSERFPEAGDAAPGLRNVASAEGDVWLVYTSTGEAPQTVGRAALPEAVALDRAGEIRAAMTFPLITALPAAALLMLGALWLGLRPLRRIEREIGSVDAQAPAPLNIDQRTLPRELRTLTAQFDRLMDTVASALVRQKAFASTASHELRTPLAGARSQLDVLERSSDPDQLAGARAMLAATLRRMDRLVTQLLMLARGEGTRREREFERLDLAALLREGREEFLKQHPEAEIELQSLSGPVEIEGSEALLRAMFRNLLENAWEHGGHAGLRITFTSGGAASVEILVEDDGPGFPSETAQDLFDPFVQMDRGSSAGAGLGLAVARSVAELHGGQIALRNRSSGGGTVIITLAREKNHP